MRGFAAEAKQIQLDLLVSEEQAPLLADCVRLGKVGRPTLLDWKRQHEELMASIAEETAKAKVAGNVHKEPERDLEGGGELAGGEPNDDPDVSNEVGGTIYVKTPKEPPKKGKGKGKAPAEQPDMGEPVSTLSIFFTLRVLILSLSDMVVA